ncbi:hypothetical protein [Pendulispora albinea]|uniref:Uncharacterized protein n=1 Tax=Pendulispora albinea TaxID=2741071 RepID=A0ABZ2LYZ8_9BACT
MSSVFFMACSDSGRDADENAQSLEQPTIINPDGGPSTPEPRFGRYTVAAPGVTDFTKFHTDSGFHPLGEWVSERAGREYLVSIRSSDGNGSTPDSYGRVNILADQDVTFRAGYVWVSLADAPATHGLSATDITDMKQLDFNFPISHLWLGPRGAKYVFAPGNYEVRYGMYDGFRFQVAADDNKVVQPWSYATRRVAKIVAPKRELPTLGCGKTHESRPLYQPRYRVTGKYSGQETSRDLTVRDESAIEVGAGSMYPGATYDIAIEGILGTRPLPLSNPGEGPLTLRLGRLDVEDVAIQKPDGTALMLRGRFFVYPMQKDSAGREFPSSTNIVCDDGALTHSGVDLVRGRYKVDVKYQYGGPEDKVLTYIVDVE